MMRSSYRVHFTDKFGENYLWVPAKSKEDAITQVKDICDPTIINVYKVERVS